MNKDLLKERHEPAFSVLELGHILAGDKQTFEERRKIQRIMRDEPLFDRTATIFKSRDGQYEENLARAVLLQKLKKKHNWNRQQERYAELLINFEFVIPLHAGNVIPALERMATPEQQAKWLPLLKSYKILATYAQTELGHGTYLPALETTATYDANSEEFILHSPSLNAMKWWPGSLGHTCTHALVMAQLITQGKIHGPHPFFVQLRSLDDHSPLPGITIGDIGPKFGINGTDNGYLGFDHIRIPREALMMKHNQILADGTYMKGKADKAAYLAMVFMRVYIAKWTVENSAKACTIAIRYSAARRQSKLDPKHDEVQILDHRTQQLKLFIPLANAYALFFCAKRLFSTYLKLEVDPRAIKELHALSAGLKAVTTNIAVKDIESCRLACGGHGYSMCSGLPQIYTDMLTCVTAEGENTVMLLQTARFLLKCVTSANSGETLHDDSVNYLNQRPNPPQKITHNGQLASHVQLLYLFKVRAYRQIHDVSRKFGELFSITSNPYSTWNDLSADLVKAAQAHCQLYLVESFVSALNSVQASPQIRNILSTLCSFFAISSILQDTADFFLFSDVEVGHVRFFQEHLLRLCQDIRPVAVLLVDAFDFPDFVLNSALGVFDGNVYQKMWEWAQKNPMNKQKIHPSYHTQIKKLLGKTSAKL